MHCHNCGNPIDENNQYCNNCGAKVRMPEESAPIQPAGNNPQTILDKLTFNNPPLSRGMNIFFWVVWSVLLLLELIMISDEFTWARCLLFLAIQAALVFLRPRFFGKVLPALLGWVAAIVLIFMVIAFTGGNPDEMAFKQYKDYRQENEAAVKVLDSFGEAADQGDVKATVGFIEKSQQKTYTDLFSKDPQKLKLIAKAVEDAEMSQLSPPETETGGYPRYAEYAVDYDNLTFHIRMVKINGQWMIDKI